MSAAPSGTAPSCLFKGEDGPKDLIGHFVPGETTHSHVVCLNGETSVHMDAETIAKMYGCETRALDLHGFNGITVEAGTTTHGSPVALTFSTTNTEGDFEPIQTLSRSTYTTSGDMGEVHQMCHYIAMPGDVGYVNGKTSVRFHPDQCVSPQATNLTVRKMRWDPTRSNMGEYETIQNPSGLVHAVPLASPSLCNISQLLSSNEKDIATIAPGSKVVTTSTGAKFAMVPNETLKMVNENLEASFKNHSAVHGGITISCKSLVDSNPMPASAVTTCTFNFMKDPESVASRVEAGMKGTAASMAGVETLTMGSIPYLLGEGTAPSGAATSSTMGMSELKHELAALMDGTAVTSTAGAPAAVVSDGAAAAP